MSTAALRCVFLFRRQKTLARFTNIASFADKTIPRIFIRATLASAGAGCRRVSVYLFVRPSVTSRCSSETAIVGSRNSATR